MNTVKVHDILEGNYLYEANTVYSEYISVQISEGGHLYLQNIKDN